MPGENQRQPRSRRKKARLTRKIRAEQQSARGTAKSSFTVSLPPFLANGTDLDFREFIADLFAAVGGMHSLRRALASSVGLSAAKFSIVLATWHLQKKGTVGISTIAKHLHVAAAHVTAEVGQLVAKGVLKKKPHPHDTRAVSVVLTHRGRKILMQLVPLLRGINDRLFSGNDASDVAVLSRFLRQLAGESANAIRMARTFAREHPFEDQR
jgi:MarR family transcriptional regulator, organic hydroperoxide resistance regulator